MSVSATGAGPASTLKVKTPPTGPAALPPVAGAVPSAQQPSVIADDFESAVDDAVGTQSNMASMTAKVVGGVALAAVGWSFVPEMLKAVSWVERKAKSVLGWVFAPIRWLWSRPTSKANDVQQAPAFATVDALKTQIQKRSNLRDEFSSMRVDDPSKLPRKIAGVMKQLRQQFGTENVSAYVVPIEGKNTYVFECPSKKHQGSFVGIYDAKGLIDTATRPWTQFSWNTQISGNPSWLEWIKKSAEKNLVVAYKEKSGREPVSRDALPEPLQSAAAALPANANWFPIPGTDGKMWAAQAAVPKEGKAIVRVFSSQGTLVASADRPFSDFKFGANAKEFP